ncbi:hypothetical protein DLM85_21820 [Hymenobacter edaphi]|uniref:histidine kinase n=1 Tax=Hymenobacter edaphi TaxID=2211146 RepID=A0A328B8G1_9BACT|nr:hypothetical protein DLM85_21820 [Hymenobacter edaphi]
MIWLFLACLLPGRPGAAQPAPPDSLAHPDFGRWPRRTQLRLADQWPTAARLPVAERLASRPALPTKVRAHLWMTVGRYYFYQEQPSRALSSMLRAQQVLNPAADSALRSEVAAELSYAYTMTNQLDPARRWGEAAARLAGGSARLFQQARAYDMLAMVAGKTHDLRRQRQYLEQVVRICRQQRAWLSLVIGLHNLAEFALAQHDLPLARACLDSMRPAAVRQHPVPVYPSVSATDLTQVCINLTAGRLQLAEGRPAAALRILQPSIADARRVGNKRVECDFLTPAITALSQLGRYREALAYQQRFTKLSSLAFDENARRQAQELDAVYATRQREQQLARQRQHIQQLQARTQAREATLRQRTLLLGAVLLGAVLLLVAVVVWLRARHLLATATATLNMRQRLAADLHDEVGTLLTRVSLQAELLGAEQPAHSPAVERLLTNSRTAARTMRDVVWGLDPQADNTTSLLDRMRDFLQQSTAPTGLEAELLTEGWPDDEVLPQLLRQQVYLVFREAVTNAVKHARGASYVRARLRREPGQLQLTIDDDGQPAVRPATDGLGLRSILRRAESLGGRLTAGPRPEGGFRVQLEVPLG